MTEKSPGYDPLLRPQMPELDAIRGLAILGVLFYHGLYWNRDLSPFTPLQKKLVFLASSGQFGVNLFFVLSGFLITGLLMDSQERSDYYKRFYIRRALRILPAYYGILLVLMLTQTTTNSFFLMSLIYCSNFSPLFGIAMSYSVLWTLSVEEHFYLIWPTAVHRLPERTLMFILGGVILLAPVFRVICHMHAAETNFVGSNCFIYTWNSADGLAFGALLSLVIRKIRSERQRVLRVSLLFIGAGLTLTAVGYPFDITTRHSTFGEALQWAPWNLGSTGLIGVFLLVGSSPWKALVAPRILLFLGRISYGLYLYHLLVFVAYDRLILWLKPAALVSLNNWESMWVRFLIAGLAAIGTSYLSRLYFEEPFLRLKNKFTPSRE